jgi:pyruvyltransferase
MRRGELAVWAWSEGVQNFGDELGPAILKRLGYEVRRVESMADADLIACGSILEAASREARDDTVVWGSGLMRDGEAVDVSRLDVRAVRGPLTARLIGVDVPTCDPGYLVPHIYRRPMGRHRVGVVRHYIDKRTYPWADLVIDASEPVDTVIDAIGSCHTIASSSLHGLIVADAWGIPTMRLHHRRVAGGNFKWADYFASNRDVDRLLECLP